MATATIRLKIDTELTKKVGKWFTVREIQDKLKINPSTLKPLIMKYARENVLVRRRVKGTPRSVEFSPASKSINGFKDLLNKNMPYRNLGACPATKGSKKTTAMKSCKKSCKKGRK